MVEQILKIFKNTRHQLIFVVLATLCGVFIFEGLYFVIVIIFFFIFRFPKSWYYFLIILIFSFIFLFIIHENNIPEILTNEQQDYQAQIIRVNRRGEDRQTAIIKINNQRIFMTFAESYPRILPGQTIEFSTSIRTPTNPTVPYRFNFKEFLSYQSIHHTIFISELTVTTQKFSIWQLQFHASDWIEQRFSPLTVAYIQAFFLGLRDNMDEESLQTFSDLGIIQLLSISGVNVTLMTGLIKNFFKRIGLVDILIDPIVIIFCILFVIFAGGSISVVRACLMTILATINRRFKFGFSSFDIFSLVFISNFLINPLIIYRAGFQFSYWISFVLICSRNVLANLSPLKSKISILYLARMASIPLTAANSFEVHLVSFLANFLVAPILMQIIIPLLLLTLIFPFIEPVTIIFIQLFESFNTFLRPFLNIQLVVGSLSLQFVFILVSIFLFSCYLYEKHRFVMIRIAMIIVYFIFFEINRLAQFNSYVTFLDVGQGDATVLRSPFHQCNIVVDTGGDVSRVRSNNPSTFAQTLEPYLLGNGVRVIDYLILTHEHYDHIAESVNLMNRFDVKNIIYNGAEVGTQMKTILDEADRLNIPVHQAKTLDSFTCGKKHLVFVQPPVSNIDTNEDSLVMTIEIDDFTFMITGDIGHVSEAAVLANVTVDSIDFYQVAHHGSRYSNSFEFLDALNVRYAIVPVGVRNFYGHPHQELFDVTDALHIPLFSSAVDGTVQIRIMRGRYEILSWPHEN